MPYAVKVTVDNIDYIIDWMKQYNFNVEYIRDDLEYNTYPGEFYAITDGSTSENNVTFTTMGSESFHDYWYFPYGETVSLMIIERRIKI